MAWDDTKQDGNIVEADEWNAMVDDIKLRLGLVFNVQSYNASPDGGTATTGSITAATNDLSVASASSFEVNHGIVVVGASLDTTDTGNTEDTDNDFTTTGGAADNEWMARKFTATNSGVVGTIANVMLKKTGAPAGTIVAMIYSDDGGGPSLPSAQIGGDSTGVTNTTLNASGAIQGFTWATDWPVIATGVDYWLVLKTVGYTYTDGVTEVIWQTDANGSVGNNECAKYDSNGAPWTTMGADIGGDITVNLNLSTTITAVSGTDITLAANATTTVSSAVVRHDEYTAINAAHTAATADGGFIWFPAGVYNLGTSISFNSDSPLWFDQAATLAINSGITATFLNMISPTHVVHSGSGSMTFGAQAITAAGDTINSDALIVFLNPDADYTMTSTPTIADGTPGQILYLMTLNPEANTVTLQDQDTLASSNLQLLASTRGVSAKKILTLIFDGVDWIEQGSVEYGTITLQGKLIVGSFSSPVDVTVTREYGAELHYSGNDYNVTGIRSRASLITTDAPTRSAIGGRFTGAANDNIDALLVEGVYIEALGKAIDNAAAIANLIGAEINVEYEDENTITNYKGLYLRLVTDTDLPAAVSYGIHIYNQQKAEADGGTLQAAIYVSDNLNPALDAYEFGLDLSGSAGDINTADIRLQNSETIKNTTDGEIEISGQLILGTGATVVKTIDLAGATFEFGATAPTGGAVGNYQTWAYGIGDDSVTTFELPHDWAVGTDLTVSVDWGINRDEVTENAEVQWNAIWSAVPHDASEVLTGAGTTIDPGDQSIPTNANTLTRTALGTIAGASLAAEDEIGIKLTRVALDGGANPGGGVEPYITHLYIEYVADKLGEAT